VPLPAQTVRTIATDFKSPYTWQSSIGFQKQINSITGFDVDLTHWTEYRDTRTIDANLAYNPATGYNQANGAALPSFRMSSTSSRTCMKRRPLRCDSVTRATRVDGVVK